MENTLRPVDALYCLALVDSLIGYFPRYIDFPCEMEAHAHALWEFFYSRCEELDPYGDSSDVVERG